MSCILHNRLKAFNRLLVMYGIQRLLKQPGACRGYRGRIVSATETHVRMELEAAYKTVTVKIGDLRNMQQPQGGWLCCGLGLDLQQMY